MKSVLPSPLPLNEWPERDRVAWLNAREGDPLAPGGGGSANALRPSTAKQYVIQYGAYLAWLKAIGTLDESEAPAARAPRARVRRYLDALEEAGLGDHSRAGRLQGLGNVLRHIDPGPDRRFLGIAAARISRDAKRVRDLHPKLRPLADVLSFGLELMAAADDPASGLTAPARAYAFRDGLLIAVWVHRQPRVANLAGLELDKTLQRVGDHHRAVFPHTEMKGARPFSWRWPPELEVPLRHYLEIYRPYLLSRRKGEGAEPSLWISQFGKGMPSGSIGQIIQLRTKAKFGEAINPHLIRYVMATDYAEAEPKQIADVAAMLHHADLETSEKHYILANSMKAIGQYQEAVLSTRRRRNDD